MPAPSQCQPFCIPSCSHQSTGPGFQSLPLFTQAWILETAERQLQHRVTRRTGDWLQQGDKGGNAETEGQRSNLQKGEVSAVSREHDLQVPHHYLTLLVELVQRLVLVLSVARHAQPVQSPRAHCSKWRGAWQGLDVRLQPRPPGPPPRPPSAGNTQHDQKAAAPHPQPCRQIPGLN